MLVPTSEHLAAFLLLLSGEEEALLTGNGEEGEEEVAAGAGDAVVDAVIATVVFVVVVAMADERGIKEDEACGDESGFIPAGSLRLRDGAVAGTLSVVLSIGGEEDFRDIAVVAAADEQEAEWVDLVLGSLCPLLAPRFALAKEEDLGDKTVSLLLRLWLALLCPVLVAALGIAVTLELSVPRFLTAATCSVPLEFLKCLAWEAEKSK